MRPLPAIVVVVVAAAVIAQSYTLGLYERWNVAEYFSVYGRGGRSGGSDLMHKKFIAFKLTIETDDDYNRNGDTVPTNHFCVT